MRLELGWRILSRRDSREVILELREVRVYVGAAYSLATGVSTARTHQDIGPDW